MDIVIIFKDYNVINYRNVSKNRDVVFRHLISHKNIIISCGDLILMTPAVPEVYFPGMVDTRKKTKVFVKISIV